MTEMFTSPSQICCLYIFLAGMDQFDRDSTIADFKNGVTNLMVRESTNVQCWPQDPYFPFSSLVPHFSEVWKCGKV